MPRPSSLSFEFFPPHSIEATLRLWNSVERLAPLGPDFVSVTYGAGGTTRDRTLDAIKVIVNRARLDVAGHLTCVGASKEESIGIARGYKARGASRIVALRGDPPKGDDSFTPHPDGYHTALELVEGLAKAGFEEISVAAYPEVHPDAPNAQADLDTLKAKQDAGADMAICQFCFESEVFLRFRDRARAHGVTIPIVPGILPVENFEKMTRFAEGCAANVPNWMHDAFSNVTDPQDSEILATAIASEFCDTLLEEGVDHLHFYTLNNPNLVFNIATALGFKAATLQSLEGRGVA